eukprot:TRINITY_DN17992_c0_g1_i1.p1 TRINITY_DN17992_c0_g1~~TRINITY_DN17992_c0_g1_i1.p1  ORF type:complete len:102 (-),score=9.65 TRINITY_DN17992_c0_g1_i1:437-742(-)
MSERQKTTASQQKQPFRNVDLSVGQANCSLSMFELLERYRREGKVKFVEGLCESKCLLLHASDGRLSLHGKKVILEEKNRLISSFIGCLCLPSRCFTQIRL